MKKISASQIRNLRNKTGAPIVRVKDVLVKYKGDEEKAEKILRKEGFEKAEKKAKRATSQGLVEAYVHHSGKIASIVEVLCETDFVARNKIFQELAHNLALQVAAMNPKNVKELMEQDFINPSGLQASLIKDPSIKVKELVKEAIAKTGENIRIGKIYRVELGK